MANELQGRKIAIFVAPAGTEQIELFQPKQAVEDAGAQVDVISDQTGEVQTVNNDLDPGETVTV
jgi:protease I